MKILAKKLLWTLFFFLLGVCFLFYAKKTAEFAYIGLHTWFENMIISLFPFMVLMNLLVEMGFTESFVKPLHFLLKPIFRNTENAVFVILFGFLCGFPLGAKSVCSLYQKGLLSRSNAEYLVSFANNIGPAYLLGFVLTGICPEMKLAKALFCFYGIPFLYGILLRYTRYRKVLDKEYLLLSAGKASLCSCDGDRDFLAALPDAVNGALTQITTLGGYMIVFNALRVIPYIVFRDNTAIGIFVNSILEISGGLLCVKCGIQNDLLRLVAVAGVFSFNGLCCHFQTLSLLQKSGLSAKKYMLHKLILCSITMLLFGVTELMGVFK